MIKNLKELEAWFLTGSQHLYGEETLKQVDKNSRDRIPVDRQRYIHFIHQKRVALE